MSTRTQYPTDLTDAQWQLIHPMLPPRKWRRGGPGRPPCDVRRVIDGIIYVTKTGCQWDMLPPTFGCWKTVYGYFNDWSRNEIWQSMMETLTQQERQRQGRPKSPSAGSVDSQSIKTSTQGAAKGYDAGKQITGRKRHLLVDTLGLILRVCVTAADYSDRVGLMDVSRFRAVMGSPP